MQKRAAENSIAIIDIGSNSIRLVVYDGLKRAPLPIYNEKVFCALGRGLESSGRLNPEGVALAKACLTRFKALVDVMEVGALHILATAAIRDASDGPSFVAGIERKLGFTINIIPGRREARLAAFGIFATCYQPQGLAGDLGGGSMELAVLAEGGIGDQVTLPIGPLRLLDSAKGDRKRIRKLIDKTFDGLPWLGAARHPHFYAIGGSFRSLARIHMQRSAYPLPILHQYCIKAAEMLPFLKEIIALSPRELADLPGVASKRAASLMPAAIVLHTLLEHAGCEDVIFSAGGIREGLLFELLPARRRHEDVLLAYCADLATQNGRRLDYPIELFEWMAPLFKKETEDMRRLRLAACMLSDIAWRIHPEYRAHWAFWRVIQSSLMGLSHKERITLALALHHRYQPKGKENSALSRLLDDRSRHWARLVGAASALGYALTGGASGTLPRTPLHIHKGDAGVTLRGAYKGLEGEQVEKRAAVLGEVFKAFASSRI